MRTRTSKSILFAIAGAGAICGLASAGTPSTFLAVTDSGNDRVAIFDPFDGSLINSSYIDLVPFDSGTPKGIIQVGNEIWVSDQIRDKIERFTLFGAHVGTIGGSVPGGGLDNIKGMAVVGNEVFVTNAGTNNGAPGDALVKIDIATASVSGSAATAGTLFDIINYNGQLLGSNIDTEDLEVYDLAGNFVSIFHDSDGTTGIDFAQQLFARANGNVYASGFSPPSGVYEYDAAGNDLGIVAGADAGARGVWELGNGNIMWTNGDGVWVTDPNSGIASLVYDGGSSQYIGLVVIPSPGAAGVLALAGVCAVRRRR
ncbi:MAG: hypothetical protein ACTS3F_02920 [Phycisphaerales bacterium]